MLTTVLAFLIAISITLGLLIVVHEWGHYWVARRLGVKILKFSIGFGTPLYTVRRGPDQTEFILAAWPLGGYVQMLDEREGEVAATEAHCAFNRQALWKRALIVFAGPAVNLIAAILIFAVMFATSGVTGTKPLIGMVRADTLAAAAGFQHGDLILAVEGKAVARWASAVEATLTARLDSELIQYTVSDSKGYTREIRMNLAELSIDDFTQGDFFDKVGFSPWQPELPAHLGTVQTGGAGDRAGLRAGDHIVAVNGTPVTDWHTWVAHIKASPQRPLTVEILRDGAPLQLEVIPDQREGEGYLGVGAKLPNPWPPEEFTAIERYNPLAALAKGAEKTWDVATLSLRILGKMLMLEVSPENISGPITIAEYAGKSFSLGFEPFLAFLGIVSVSLGVMNLLPIPILDGGHLLGYLIEWAKGSPLSERSEALLQKMGLSILLFLMGLALFNDMNRLFGM